MSLYTIDFNNKVIELLPPDKRQPKIVRWLQSLISPLVYQNNKILIDYKTGGFYPQWADGNSYDAGTIINYFGTLYISLVDGNGDTPPSGNWGVYLPTSIGTDTRLLFTGQKLVLEYALNINFGTTFRQPPDTSDIYIRNVSSSVAFLVAETDANSNLYAGETTGNYIGSRQTMYFPTGNVFINYPSDLIDTNPNIETEILSFFNKYAPFGCKATVNPV
jgi:hypothetical protein